MAVASFEARQGNYLVLILAFFFFFPLKKRLIEKIIPRKNWIGLKSISEPQDFKIFWGGLAPDLPKQLVPSALETSLVFFLSLAKALI